VVPCVDEIVNEEFCAIFDKGLADLGELG